MHEETTCTCRIGFRNFHARVEVVEDPQDVQRVIEHFIGPLTCSAALHGVLQQLSTLGLAYNP